MRLSAVVALIVAGAAWWAWPAPAIPPASCSVAVSQGRFAVSPEQAGNAATIAAVGARLGMPAHAVTVALATALQESRLVNLPSGDRDSAGLFQQRPSQGWGTYTQVTDPVHAATAFYTALQRLPDWRQAPVTAAAQAVQRSAAPLAYATWETDARAMAVALTGEAPAGLTCTHLTPAPGGDLAATFDREWGTPVVTARYATQRGWAVSSWLVAHAAGFGIRRVAFGGMVWTAATGAWRPDAAPVPQQLSYQRA